MRLRDWATVLAAPSNERRCLQRRLRGIESSTLAFRKDAQGVAQRECPICGYHGLFSPHGRPPRLDARCPNCLSLERHRHIRLYCERHEPFHAEHRLLHFAPEKHLRDYIAPRVAIYETADLKKDPALTYSLNIEDTGLPPNQYDWIVCNHVLEHVDDRKALAEMFRMLKPGGRALLTMPVAEAMPHTYEDPSITTPEARLVHYGQADHVRFFGRDVRDRIRAAGFSLEEFSAPGADIVRYGLGLGDTIFIATKPA